jgi:hypothetical protein
VPFASAQLRTSPSIHAAATHTPVPQSSCARHAPPTPHGPHAPPQSTSVSTPLRAPSVQLGATQAA